MKHIHWKIWLGTATLIVFLYLTTAKVYGWIPEEVAEAPMFALVAATGFCVCLIQSRRSNQREVQNSDAGVLGRWVVGDSHVIPII